MSDLLAWPALALAAGNMAWASLFALVVLAIRRPFARAFGAGPAYALWLLPAARLLLPPLPAFPALWPDDLIPLPQPAIILSVEDAAAPLPLDSGPGQWVPIMLALWALGAAALLIWQALAYRRFVARLALSDRSLGDHRRLRIVESAGVDGPLAVGLVDRRIVVPTDFLTRYDRQERDLALDHEAVHHHRGDLWWNHAALLIVAANWFNPVAWIAFRAFRIDQELACDAAVTASADPQARHAYAQALVKSVAPEFAGRPGLIAACPLNQADQLKRRLRMMKDHRRSAMRRLSGAGALALLAGIGLAAGAPVMAEQASGAAPQTEAPNAAQPGDPAAQPRVERRETRIIMHTEDGPPRQAGAPADGTRRNERMTIIERRDRAPGDASAAAGIPQPPAPPAPPLPPEVERRMEQCRAGAAFNANETDGNRRVRIHVCNEGGTPVANAQALQRARDRLATDTNLSAETRQRLLTQLDAAIAQARR